MVDRASMEFWKAVRMCFLGWRVAVLRTVADAFGAWDDMVVSLR